ncbi:MAG: MobQ family relaxase [Ralstonia sp.]
MASYHFTVKTVSRSAGRSATAAAAYRAGVEIADARTGEIHDYRRKAGVESAELVLPADAPEWAAARSALWNAVEQAETRKNSTVAREFEIALPHELTPEVRKRLAADFAGELVQRHGFAVDVAIHAPGKKGDIRNHHAHVLCSTRRLTPEGIGEKTRELDDMKIGPQEVERWRERWAEMGGDALERAGFKVQAARYRAGHLPLEKQVQAARERGDLAFVSEHENREPTRHLGPSAVGFERRTGRASKKRVDFDQVAAERLAQAKRAGELERQANALDEMILDITMTIAQAKAERDRQRQSMLWGTGVNIAELREQLERSKQKRTKLAPAIQVEQPREVRVATPPIRTTSAVRQRRDDDFEP